METRSITNYSPIPSLEMCALVGMGGNGMHGWRGGSWRTTSPLPTEFTAIEGYRHRHTSELERFTEASPSLPPPVEAHPVAWPSRWVAPIVARIREWFVGPPPVASGSGEVCITR